MRDIDNYTKDAINSRLNWAHKVEDYRKYTEYGVTTVSYHAGLTGGWIALGTVTIIPGLIALGDKAFNDGNAGTPDVYHYFDAYTGEMISESKANELKKQTKNNNEANSLNQQGIELFSQGKYAEAAEKQGQAYSKCSSGYSSEQAFKDNRDQAKAQDLNAQGDKLYNDKNYVGAIAKYEAAEQQCPTSRKTDTYKNNIASALNQQGIELFSQGKYAEAAEKQGQAYSKCSSGYSSEQAFKDNRDQAKAQVLNDEGNKLHNGKKYSEAINKYQQAYNTCTESRNRDTYSTNKSKSQTEIDAINLNNEGDSLFTQGKYAAALVKYQEAYDKSQVEDEYLKYSANKKKAQTEIDAINLNNEGDRLFIQGKYNEAITKHKAAYDKSQVTAEKQKYSTNQTKVQVEVDAIALNDAGDKLFNEEKYNDALGKYQEAYNKSQITKEKNIYDTNKVKVQTIINKLSVLDTLWNEAWDAENDEENDRSEEAKELFQKVLSESRNGLKIFSSNLKFKQYETLVSSKIEGNKSFNKGIESQQDGIELLEEAKKLEQQQKYKLADVKFKEAKNKFFDAQEKFKIGCKSDQRFEPCIKFVQVQIEEVIQSIKITEQHKMDQAFNNLNITINSSNHLEHGDFYEPNITGDHNIYYEQI
jgi:tetratricopeptide (TPR) repeat protein